MNRWRFLLSGRWAGYLALTIVFAIVCIALGTWQLNRRAEALVEVARIDANYDARPVPVGDALPRLDEFDERDKWLPVEMTGEYVAGEQVLIRNRPQGGSTGVEVVTPLRLADGSVFMIDRGWLPAVSTDDPPDAVAAALDPPKGTVTVVARLKAGEPAIQGRTTSGNRLATIDLDELAERMDEPSYTGAYGLLVSESPAAGERPAAAIRPVRDQGPHLSYALQWYVFAILGFIGLGWAANQERRTLAMAAGEHPPPTSRTRPDRPNDADVEDGILDAQR
jgi:cytochrome oxidase assembly protein ShyY1